MGVVDTWLGLNPLVAILVILAIVAAAIWIVRALR